MISCSIVTIALTSPTLPHKLIGLLLLAFFNWGHIIMASIKITETTIKPIAIFRIIHVEGLVCWFTIGTFTFQIVSSLFDHSFFNYYFKIAPVILLPIFFLGLSFIEASIQEGSDFPCSPAFKTTKFTPILYWNWQQHLYCNVLNFQFSFYVLMVHWGHLGYSYLNMSYLDVSQYS